MNVPEGRLFFTEEVSAKRTITGEVGSKGNDELKLVNILIDSHEKSSSCEWLNSIMNIDVAESSSSSATTNSKTKITKIPEMFRGIESNDDCYDPIAVSIGPYHHGKLQLKEIENLKMKMANQYVKNTEGKNIHDLYAKVKEVAGEAKKCYDLSSAIDDESFTRMMFLDGCFLLQYIHSSVHGQQYMEMKSHHVAFVQRDLFLLENQLPYIVLKALMSIRFKDDEGKNMIDKFVKLNNLALPPKSWRNPFVWLRDSVSYIIPYIKSAGQAPKLPTSNSSSTIDDQPRHLLDIMRKSFVGSTREVGNNSAPEDWSNSYHSASELNKMGIRFKPNQSCCCTDVVFSLSPKIFYRNVTLPRLVIDGSTKSMLLNMVAFETSPSGPDDVWVTSFICFMDSLINNAEDVTVLRSQRTLVNCLSSDQHVADLFNGIAKYLAPNALAYGKVKQSIADHYNNQIKVWIGELLNQYFSSPWSFLAFFGAIVGLLLTALQTYTAVRPQPNPPKQ